MQRPILQALLVADYIYTDKDSGQKIIAGVRRRIAYFVKQDKELGDEPTSETEKPKALGGVTKGGIAPFIYLSLTEIYEQQDFILRYVNLETDQARFEKSITVISKDPIEPVEAVFPLPELPMEQGSDYAVELFWKGEILGSFRIKFIELEPPES